MIGSHRFGQLLQVGSLFAFKLLARSVYCKSKVTSLLLSLFLLSSSSSSSFLIDTEYVSTYR